MGEDGRFTEALGMGLGWNGMGFSLVVWGGVVSGSLEIEGKVIIWQFNESLGCPPRGLVIEGIVISIITVISIMIHP